jgi:hypothetical protein
MGPYKQYTKKSFALKLKQQTTIDVYSPSSLHGKWEKEHAYMQGSECEVHTTHQVDMPSDWLQE